MNTRAEAIAGAISRLQSIRKDGQIDQLSHAMQTASRAADVGAARNVVFMAFVHDIGKSRSWRGHGEHAAELLAPFLPPGLADIVRHHALFGPARKSGDLWRLRGRFRSNHDFDLAVTFAFEWDLTSWRDATYPCRDRAYFDSLVAEMCGVLREGDRA